MAGLNYWDAFPEEADMDGWQIPTIIDLLNAEDIPIFTGIHRVFEVTFNWVTKISQPPAVILLTREVYHGLVTTVSDPGDDYSYLCDVFDTLNYIQLVARNNNGQEQYNPFIYFLIATYQQLNPVILGLNKTTITSQEFLEWQWCWIWSWLTHFCANPFSK